jgi:hypothetical protein
LDVSHINFDFSRSSTRLILLITSSSLGSEERAAIFILLACDTKIGLYEVATSTKMKVGPFQDKNCQP